MFDNDYLIKGSHGDRIRFLNLTSNKNDESANAFGPFKAAIDVYILAPLIGVLENKKSSESTGGKDFRIFAGAFSTHKKDVETVYRLVLLSEKNELTNDEKIDRAFKVDDIPEKHNANMDLFHTYMRGGIDWLYEKIVDEKSTLEDDYIENLLETVKDFDDLYNISKDED